MSADLLSGRVVRRLYKRGFDILITNCYKLFMDKGPLASWFEKAYLKFQLSNGRSSLGVFAYYLGISRGYLSQILNGYQKSIAQKTAVQISQRLDDYSLLDLLGYLRPTERQVSFSSLPPELQNRLRSALEEIDLTLRTHSIHPDSPEGLETSTTVLRKFGFTVSSITNS